MDNNNSPERPKLLTHGAKNFVLGLKVLFGECRWICVKAIRGFEIRQMRKRLDEEYAFLGKALAAQLEGVAITPGLPMPPADADTELCLKQIAFLKEEIAFLSAELERLRAEYQSARLAAGDEDRPA